MKKVELVQCANCRVLFPVDDIKHGRAVMTVSEDAYCSHACFEGAFPPPEQTYMVFDDYDFMKGDR